jgi:hypothetical protein
LRDHGKRSAVGRGVLDLAIARPPPAPGLSSTMTFWPMFVDMACATTVAMRSAVVPLPKGTTMVIGRSG